jgi:recombination protein RecA
MAKKKAKNKVDKNALGNMELLERQLEKEFGVGVVTSADDILDKPKTIFSIAPHLDAALCGGIPEGVIISCAGKPKIGKTTTALHFAAKCQRPEYGNRVVYFIDVEGRLEKRNLNSIPGLDTSKEKFRRIGSQPGKILTAEEFLTITERIIKTIPGCIIIFDSFSALCADSEMNSEYTANARNQGPKLMAAFCRRVGNAIPVNNVTLWGIQHVIANTSGMGQGSYIDGGNKIKYQLDVQIQAMYHESWDMPAENPIGHKIHWKVVTSALGPPVKEVVSYHRFGIGIDELYENMQLGKDFGFIQVAGSWLTYGDCKVQGEANMYEHIKENPEIAEQLRNEIKEII